MLKLPVIFQDGMVLQRDVPVRLWGTGEPGKEVCAWIQNQTATTICDATGAWKMELPFLHASVEETLKISSGDQELIFQDVAVGDVYLAAGQSNMEFYMRYEKNYRMGNSFSENPEIRFFDVPEIAFAEQEKAFDYSQMSIWRKATAKDIEFFSAVAYYAAAELQEDQKVPVGILGCNWGGTFVAAWMSRDTAERVALPWVKAFEVKKEQLNWETYYQEEAANPANGRGRPFEDAFTELMVPRTPSREEIAAFFEEHPNGGDPSRLMPANVPGCLYEHMVKKAAPFSIRAVLYYQGESDDEMGFDQENYHIRLRAMMEDWRALWGNAKLPFFIVQLPGFREWLDIPVKNWNGIRDSQRLVTEEDEHAHLCSISDAGEEYDIHPKDKKIVGHRLALLMRKYLYKEEILADAPKLKEAHREGQKVRLVFEHAGEGLKLCGEKLQGFEVSCPFALAQIEKDTLTLTLEESENKPVAISMGQGDWYLLNLKNSADIPVIPFQVTV